MTNDTKQLLIEFTNFDVKEEGKHLYLVGPMARAEGPPNRNGRTYPKKVLEAVAKTYMEEKVKAGSAWGTLGHEPSPKMDEMRIPHLVTELWWDGNVLYGKARVLGEGSPCGQQLAAMLRAAKKIGMSTRGLGSVNENNVVQDDYRLVSIDAVTDPSAHGAYVKGIVESAMLVEQTLFAEDGDVPVNNASGGGVDGLDDNPPGRKHQFKKMLTRRKEVAMKEGHVPVGWGEAGLREFLAQSDADGIVEYVLGLQERVAPEGYDKQDEDEANIREAVARGDLNSIVKYVEHLHDLMEKAAENDRHHARIAQLKEEARAEKERMLAVACERLKSRASGQTGIPLRGL